MSTYTQILYQIVFGTYDYTPFLNTENENVLFAYIAGILKNKSCHSYIAFSTDVTVAIGFSALRAVPSLKCKYDV